jgi:hypothetical protein
MEYNAEEWEINNILDDVKHMSLEQVKCIADAVVNRLREIAKDEEKEAFRPQG